jgi:hypothetical protein
MKKLPFTIFKLFCFSSFEYSTYEEEEEVMTPFAYSIVLSNTFLIFTEIWDLCTVTMFKVLEECGTCNNRVACLIMVLREI